MSRTLVMGIVNVTPDSFSDGGMYFRPEEALRRAANCVREGADIVDLGGESTRPGATELDWRDEWSRLEPVVGEAVRRLGGRARISVDTYHPETAERALGGGAAIVNCVRAESALELSRVALRGGAEIVVPAAVYGEVVAGGFPAERAWLDPMVGFGTTREEDLARLRSIGELSTRGRVLVGASRKRIVKKLTGEKVTGRNLGGSVGLAVWCALRGASAVRVHDVAETVQALAVAHALEGNCDLC